MTKPRIIFAEDGEDFQEYSYTTGGRVTEGEPVGIEIFKNDEWEFKILSGIRYC
jgi:hypothetical protein